MRTMQSVVSPRLNANPSQFHHTHWLKSSMFLFARSLLMIKRRELGKVGHLRKTSSHSESDSDKLAFSSAILEFCPQQSADESTIYVPNFPVISLRCVVVYNCCGCLIVGCKTILYVMVVSDLQYHEIDFVFACTECI